MLLDKTDYNNPTTIFSASEIWILLHRILA
jgi:hypothetical protein